MKQLSALFRAALGDRRTQALLDHAHDQVARVQVQLPVRNFSVRNARAARLESLRDNKEKAMRERGVPSVQLPEAHAKAVDVSFLQARRERGSMRKTVKD